MSIRTAHRGGRSAAQILLPLVALTVATAAFRAGAPSPVPPHTEWLTVLTGKHRQLFDSPAPAARPMHPREKRPKRALRELAGKGEARDAARARTVPTGTALAATPQRHDFGLLAQTGQVAMPTYSLRVNGRTRQVDVDADTPLLWVLRDVLNLTGAKYGCGIAQCGACTVHLNGAAVRACTMQVSRVGDRAITTIEGLSPDGTHAVQKAWVAEDVPQCGFCQSGQVMAAAALLAKTRKPSDAAIDEAMAGNLCRCGTYDRIRNAIHRAAQEG